MKSLLPALTMLLAAAASAHVAQRWQDSVPLPEPIDPHETLPAVEALRFMSLDPEVSEQPERKR